MQQPRIAVLFALIGLSIPAIGRAADATPAAAETTEEGEAAAAPVKTAKAAAPVRPANTSLPFRLGLYYAHAFAQSGDLTREITLGGGNGNKLPSPAVFGLDLGIGLGSHVRYHFAAGLEWESQTRYAAKGFRFDLIGLGFPILVWQNDDVTVHIEPLVHLVRGEIMFQSEPANIKNTSLFRIESGIAGAITAVTHHWFFAVEPLSLDFRVFEANNQWVHTGFSQLFWFQVTAGHEF